jgi:hypothetical protein
MTLFFFEETETETGGLFWKQKDIRGLGNALRAQPQAGAGDKSRQLFFKNHSTCPPGHRITDAFSGSTRAASILATMSPPFFPFFRQPTGHQIH